MTPKLGEIITGDAQRDAIHIAVAPVVAAERLAPGMHVGVVGTTDGVVTVGHLAEKIGIVDPFLNEYVLKGQRFWIFLYPHTIAYLRHDWVHPAFAGRDQISQDEAWIRAWAASVEQVHGEPLTYDKLMDGARQFLESGSELESDGPGWMNLEVPEEFWDHYERVVGKPIPDVRRGTFFACAC